MGPIPRDGLVLECRLAGHADDTSGHGRHGVLHGATPTTDRLGRANAALHFDGVDDYVIIDPPPVLSSDALSLSVWVRFDAPPPDDWSNCIVCQDDGDDADPSRRIFQLSALGGRIVWHRMTWAPDPATQRDVVPGEWQHVAVVYRDGVHELRVNGQVHASTAHALRRSAEEPVYIGRKGTPEPYFFFRGGIDDLRLYNRALSEGEIAALVGEDGYVLPAIGERIQPRVVRERRSVGAAVKRRAERVVHSAVRLLRARRRPAKAANEQRMRERGETPASLVIRDATPDDIVALADLHVRTWSATYPGVRRPPTHAIREGQWREAFANDDGSWFCLVVERPRESGGGFVGFAKGARDAKANGNLSKIYLLDEYQRLGLGRRLVGHVARRMLSIGVTRMFVWVDPGNPSSGFYEALGADAIKDDKGRVQAGAYIWRDLAALAAKCPPE